MLNSELFIYLFVTEKINNKQKYNYEGYYAKFEKRIERNVTYQV